MYVMFATETHILKLHSFSKMNKEESFMLEKLRKIYNVKIIATISIIN